MDNFYFQHQNAIFEKKHQGYIVTKEVLLCFGVGNAQQSLVSLICMRVKMNANAVLTKLNNFYTYSLYVYLCVYVYHVCVIICYTCMCNYVCNY